MKKSSLILILITMVNACHINQTTIIGKWKNRSDGTVLIFNKGGQFETIDSSGQILSEQLENLENMSYDTIDAIDPHQLYVTMTGKDKSKRMPFAIYEVRNDVLVIRAAIEYHRTLGGIDMGISRIEFPKDFSGHLEIYDRIN